jgi:hypothetical protein
VLADIATTKMTATLSTGGPWVNLAFSTSGGYCSLHGYYYGAWSCPQCVSTPIQIQPYVPPQTVAPSPVSTEDAIQAMVTAFIQLINDLREQVAERDRQIEELIAKLEQQ